jgi:hypothetical protein
MYTKIYSRKNNDTSTTKITPTKIVLVAYAHAGPSKNARPASEKGAPIPPVIDPPRESVVPTEATQNLIESFLPLGALHVS